MEKRTQINFDIRPDIHIRIKTIAAYKRISMNLWLTRIILEALKKEEGEGSTTPSSSGE